MAGRGRGFRNSPENDSNNGFGRGGRGQRNSWPGRYGGHGFNGGQRGGLRGGQRGDGPSDNNWTVQRSKRQRANAGGEDTTVPVNLEVFDSLSFDDKLGAMMRKLCQIDKMQITLNELSSRMDETSEEIRGVREDLDEVDNRLSYIEYRALDLEARSRRNNLCFFGFAESEKENCETKVRRFIYGKLSIDNPRLVIQRAHRLGATRGKDSLRNPVQSSWLFVTILMLS